MKKWLLFSLITVLVVGQAIDAAALPKKRGKQQRVALPLEWKQMNPQLKSAVIKGDVGEVKRLVATGLDINALDADGNTALILAAMYGEYAVAKELLDQKNIDVYIKGKNGKTASDWTSTPKKAPIKWLIRRKTN